MKGKNSAVLRGSSGGIFETQRKGRHTGDICTPDFRTIRHHKIGRFRRLLQAPCPGAPCSENPPLPVMRPNPAMSVVDSPGHSQAGKTGGNASPCPCLGTTPGQVPMRLTQRQHHHRQDQGDKGHGQHTLHQIRTRTRGGPTSGSSHTRTQHHDRGTLPQAG